MSAVETKMITRTISSTPSNFIDTQTFETSMKMLHRQQKIKILKYHWCPARGTKSLMVVSIWLQRSGVQSIETQIYWKEVTILRDIHGYVLLCTGVTQMILLWRIRSKLKKLVHREKNRISSLKKISCNCILINKILIWGLFMVIHLSSKRIQMFTTHPKWTKISHSFQNIGCIKVRWSKT